MPRGASGSGRAALTSCSSIGVRRRHDTPSWCGCQPYFAFSPRTRRMLCGMRAASHSILEDLRCRVRSWGTWTSPAHALYEMQAQSLHSMRPRAGRVETPSAQSLHCPRCAIASMHTEARRKVCCHSHTTCPYTSQCHAIACPCRASTTAQRQDRLGAHAPACRHPQHCSMSPQHNRQLRGSHLTSPALYAFRPLCHVSLSARVSSVTDVAHPL